MKAETILQFFSAFDVCPVTFVLKMNSSTNSCLMLVDLAEVTCVVLVPTFLLAKLASLTVNVAVYVVASSGPESSFPSPRIVVWIGSMLSGVT